MKDKSPFNKAWILEKGIPIVKSYRGELTLRSLHYRLVAKGMTNDINHYKKVVNAMGDARWEHKLHWTAFQDLDRELVGSTNYEGTTVDDAIPIAEEQIKIWANSYHKNRWENQPVYLEVFIEKKAQQLNVERICEEWDLGLCPCKGYPSLTYLYKAAQRFEDAHDEGKECKILYLGDYDCSGEDIPRSIIDTLEKMGAPRIELERVMLLEEQVTAWNLPPAPSKASDSRSRTWNGLGQVEMDAVMPEKIKSLLNEAIKANFIHSLYAELQEQEEEEQEDFKRRIKDNFHNLLD